jgi:hypothetical protein
MDSMVKLLDIAPEVEVANGLLYILLEGKRAFAYPPHVARLTNNRIKRALDEMDAANVGKVVAFR